MVEKMRRRESLESESNGNQGTLEFDREEKKREKMVVTLFGRGKIWIVGRDVEWVWHVGVFGLFNM
jgi:hypothetical protein